ncbi:CPBP family intramembrane glutamic endopeptidase [Staphylococcus shinii]|uniref:CPBP family intramembrane glutamic endopeptidase n=1 Tax=Staphylococcus shinii TaxID=2912228 RepID=UPI003F56F5CF
MKSFIHYFIHIAVWLFIIYLISVTSVVHDPNIVMYYFIGVCMLIFLITLMYSKTTVINRYSLEYDNKDKQSKDIVFILLLVATFHLIRSFVDISQTMMFGYEILPNDKSILDDTGLYLPFFISGAILTPIIEEIVFRGYMYVLINRIFVAIQKKRKYTANPKVLNSIYIIVSSIVFCSLHFPDSFLHAIPYFTGGVLLSSLFIITKRIWVGMILHVVNNSAAALNLIYKHESILPLWQQITAIGISIFIGAVLLLNYSKIKKFVLRKPYV